MPIKDEIIAFRVTPLEHARIKQTANDLGFAKVSPFIREALSPMISGKKVRDSIIDRRGLTQVYVELRRSNAALRDIIAISQNPVNDNKELDVRSAQKQMKGILKAEKMLLKLIA